MSLFKLQLADAVVDVVWLQVGETYEGLLEGLPTRRLNEGAVKGAMDDAHKVCGRRIGLTLVDPEVLPLNIGRETFMGSPVERLPELSWLVRLASLDPVDPRHEASLWKSHAAVVCFTRAIGPDGSPRVALEEVLGSLLWRELATDFEV